MIPFALAAIVHPSRERGAPRKQFHQPDPAMLNPDETYARAFWGEIMAEEEPLREERFPLVEIQTSIARIVINRYLPRFLKILDAGAGTGRYSLPLAAAGHRVTHLDVSGSMLRRAMAEAAKRELATIEFVSGDVKDLSALASRSYDLTLCLDAPISYAYPDHEQALAEVCRVTAQTVVVMVSSRSGVVPFMIDMDLSGEYVPPGTEAAGGLFPMTEAILEQGVESFPEETRRWLEEQSRLTPKDYAFTVPELTALFRKEGFRIVEIGGPGALARSVSRESLQQILQDPVLLERFIDFSLEFDFDTHNLGLGAVNLLAVAQRDEAMGAGDSPPGTRPISRNGDGNNGRGRASRPSAPNGKSRKNRRRLK